MTRAPRPAAQEADRLREQLAQLTARARPGRSRGLGVPIVKSGLCGASVWARRSLHGRFRRPGQAHAAQLVVQNPAAGRKLGEEREAAGALAARAAQLRERLAAQV